MKRFLSTHLIVMIAICGSAGLMAQQAGAPAAKPPQPQVLAEHLSFLQEGQQSDFPVLAADKNGGLWIAFVSWDGQQDRLRLAKRAGDAIQVAAEIAGPGIIHQPSLAAAGDGSLWAVWSQTGTDDLMSLHARRIRDGKPEGDPIILAKNKGPNVFSHATTDAAGRVWVGWQSMRNGLGEIFCRVFDPAKSDWSREIQVTRDLGGDWEPRLAFDGKDGAWVLYDSSRGNEFNILATHVSLDGAVGEPKTLVKTPRYEGRVSAVAAADGKGLWFAFERGRSRWGLDVRAHEGAMGLNGQKEAVLAYWDFATDKVEEAGALTPLLEKLEGPAGKPAARSNTKNPKKKAAGARNAQKLRKQQSSAAKTPAPSQPAKENRALLTAANLPQVMLDAHGHPWVAVRYFRNFAWRIALARWDTEARRWTEPVALPSSVYTQDRLCRSALAPDGGLWLCWPTDGRTDKNHQTSQLHLARVLTDKQLALAPAVPAMGEKPLADYLNVVTPERPLSEHHAWEHGGARYTLYFGDFHRHTDISNCITANDGCVVEQFRYACDMGKLDFLGTSDHTDAGKIYHPYEWWLNQKLVDAFYSPGRFTSMFAYEREQKWPHGHRNIIFARRGGPVVYINRAKYLASPWQRSLPVKSDGETEIMADELWSVLKTCGIPCTAISHTGATGMGTDWNLFTERFGQVDHRVENVLEIYQGARVSYEGLGAPQPTVGLLKGQAYNPAAQIGIARVPFPIKTFGDKNNGVYQNALQLGQKLGVFANSDHISTHTSYGGVYVKEFTREGIIEALNARRSIAATDKIFLEFTCNGRLLGSEFELAEKPDLSFAIEGTSKISRVTIVRNEKDYQSFEPGAKTFRQTFVDESPIEGENRYYLRVQQDDGNMAWSSPVWVTFKKA